MNFKPITITSLADQAFEKVVTAIIRGDFEPGERISEVQVARQLGISRGPLREALSRLEGRRLVTRRPNLGMFVTSLSERDLDELFTLREALEGMACRLAATEMSDKDIVELENLLKKHDRAKPVRNGSSYYQESFDEDFHFRIVRGSKNERLIKALCDELYYQVRVYRFRSSRHPGRTRNAIKEHEDILNALKSRDPQAAEQAMRRHIAAARQNLFLSQDAPARRKLQKAIA